MKKWMWLAVTFTIVVLDQLTKFWAAKELVFAKVYPILPLFNLRLAYNRGAAFSILSNAGGWQRWFFVMVSIVVSGILFSWLYKLPRQAKLQCAAISCILGGALGNLVDRAYSGEVIDFLDFYYKNYHWPTFNLADSFICIGAFLLLLDLNRTIK